jgi:hypothetical protein
LGKVEKMFKIPLEVETNHCDGWPSKEVPLKTKVEMKKSMEGNIEDEMKKGSSRR